MRTDTVSRPFSWTRDWPRFSWWKRILPLAVALLSVALLYDDAALHLGDLTVREPDNRHHTFPFFSHWLDSFREYGALDPWNPYVWAGTPALGQPSVPLNAVIYGLLHLPKPLFILAMNFHLLAELVLAALGFLWLLRREGLSFLLAGTGAFLYLASSSAIVTGAFYGTFFHFVVIPWALLALQTQGDRHWSRTLLFLTALFYYQITYGQLQFTLYTAYFLLALVAWLWRERFPRGRTLKLLAGAYGLAALGASHFLLPLFEYLALYPDRISHDWSAFAERDRSSWRYLTHWLIPEFFWNPSGWWPPGWGPWESLTVYVGPLYTTLFLFSLRHLFYRGGDPLARRWALLSLALFWLNTTVLGGTLLTALQGGRELPFARSAHLLLFPLLFLSLGELRRVLHAPAIARQSLGALALAMVALLLLRQPTLLRRYIDGFFLESSSRVPDVLDRLLWFQDTHQGFFLQLLDRRLMDLLALGVLTLLLARLPTNSATRRITGVSLVGLSLWAAYSFHHYARPRAEDRYPYPRTLAKQSPLLDWLQTRDYDRHYFHYYLHDRDENVGLTPNENATYRVAAINGYTNLVPRRNELEASLFRVSFGQPYEESLLRLLSVRYTLVREQRRLPAFYRDRMKVVLRQGPYLVLEYPDALPRIYFPRRLKWTTRAQMVEALRHPQNNPETLSFGIGEGTPFETDAGCRPQVRVVGKYLSERRLHVVNPCGYPVWMAWHLPLHPWWHVESDGTQVPLRVGNLFHRLVEIPPGEHVVSSRCRPVSFWAGLALSAVAALLTLGLWSVPRKATALRSC